MVVTRRKAQAEPEVEPAAARQPKRVRFSPEVISQSQHEQDIQSLRAAFSPPTPSVVPVTRIAAEQPTLNRIQTPHVDSPGRAASVPDTLRFDAMQPAASVPDSALSGAVQRTYSCIDPSQQLMYTGSDGPPILSRLDTPPQDNNPVTVRIKLSQLSEIDCQKGTFCADVLIEACWMDHAARTTGRTGCDEWPHWKPLIVFDNFIRQASDNYELVCEFEGSLSGKVTHWQSLCGGVFRVQSHERQLEAFPFDTQVLAAASAQS